jgi:hypothetical protein
VNYYDEYKAKGWNQGDSAYLNRGWCRLEMIYASVVPAVKDKSAESAAIAPLAVGQSPMKRSPRRGDRFGRGLHYYVTLGKRPQLLYGNHEMLSGLPPVVLPPLKQALFELYSPITGRSVSVSSAMCAAPNVRIPIQQPLTTLPSLPRYSRDMDKAICKELLERVDPFIHWHTRGYRGQYNR